MFLNIKLINPMIGLPKAQAEISVVSSNPDALAGVDAQRGSSFPSG